MKKVSILFMALVMCISFCACGDDGKNDREEKNEEKTGITEITVGEQYVVDEYIDFTINSITNTDIITGSMGGGLYYDNDNSEETYIDVVFDMSNLSKDSISVDEIMTAYAQNADDDKFEDVLYCIEEDDMTGVSSYGDINALEDARVHVAISVPKSETEFVLYFEIDSKKFSCEYSAEKPMKTTTLLNVGEVLDEADYASLTYIGTEFTDDLLPSNTSRYFNHYQIDNTSNTYMVLKFELTNYQSTAIDIDKFIGAKAWFDNKYQYTGFIVAEDSDGAGFSAYSDVSPLETVKLFYLIEVPKTVMDMDYEVDVVFNKKTYTISK